MTQAILLSCFVLEKGSIKPALENEVLLPRVDVFH